MPSRSSLLVACLLLGCASTPAEIVVVFDVDPGLGATDLDVEVTEPDGDVETTSFALADLGGALPTLGLVHRGGFLSPLQVDVTARGVGIASARAITGFQQGERRVLRIGLYAACAGVSCGIAQTCDRTGTCIDALVPGESLLPWTGDPTPIGFSDAGPGNDTPLVDPDAPGAERCLHAWSCSSLDPCLGTGAGRTCRPRGRGVLGDACTTDADCGSGGCIGAAGDFVCSPSCRSNGDCVVGGCVLDDLGLVGNGVCRFPSSCAGCTASGSVCVVLASRATMCVNGRACFFGSDCGPGEVCSVPQGAAGGTGVCMPGVECAPNELRLIAAGGSSFCTLTVRPCTTAADCEGTTYDECLFDASLGLDAGGLGICARRL